MKQNASAVEITNYPEDRTVYAGDMIDFNRNMTPKTGIGKATDKTRWVLTDDTAGAEVDLSNGEVVAARAGSYTITAYTYQSSSYPIEIGEDGEYTNYTAVSEPVTITVLEKEPTPTPALTDNPTPTPAPSAPPVTGSSAASVGAGLPCTVPAGDAVDEGWFADAVFVGNSRTEGLRMYSNLAGAQFFSSVGLTVTSAFTEPCVNLDGQLLTVAEALERADYGKVYIMLGLNELGWVYESVFAEDYGKIIDVIRSSHPEAEIYVQSIMPVSRLKDGDGGVYTNANVVRLQKALCEMCLEKGVHYVNVAEAVQDAEGFLPDASTPDGVHLTPECCGLWADYLKTHTGV